MPNRIVRDYTDSYRFENLSSDAERLFMRLIVKADDYGRYPADPRLIRSGCFPLLSNLRDTDITRWLDALQTAGLVIVYQVRGRSYLAIINFRQRLRQMKGKFPPPDGKPDDWQPDDCRSVDGQSTDNGLSDDGLKRNETKRSRNESEEETETNPQSPQGGESGRCSAFEKFWSAYPSKVGKISAQAEFKRQGCSELIEAILAAIARQKTWEKWTRGIIPNPRTWLHQHRWEDEPPNNGTSPVTFIP